MPRAFVALMAASLAACALPHRSLDAATNDGDAADRAMDVPVDEVAVDVPCTGVDLQTSIYHCGMCGNACAAPPNAEPTCVAGACGFTCRAGAHRCGEACLVDDSTESCGTNCSPCVPPDHGTSTCNAGMCGYTCASGFHACSGICVDDSSLAACGTDCRPCVPPSGGTAACVGGVCQGGCGTGTHLCSGACVSDTDVNACGSSCAVCAAPPNAVPACRSNACGFDCASGFQLVAGACIPATCGNRMLESGESCDDGNHAAGDGCSPACAMELGVITATCPATSGISITAPGTYVYSGDTSGGMNMLTDCSAGGPEQAIGASIDVGRAFTMQVTVHPTTSWRPVVRHSGDCASLTCTDSGSNGADVTYPVSVGGASTGRFVIDGRGGGGDHGPWVLTLVVN